ncbi:hypothetical protein J6590_026115 [Homalodisca vitripennis]|nr:hypothetical protein J6590_026115 [Homalodisca vitripennis]
MNEAVGFKCQVVVCRRPAVDRELALRKCTVSSSSVVLSDVSIAPAATTSIDMRQGNHPTRVNTYFLSGYKTTVGTTVF